MIEAKEIVIETCKKVVIDYAKKLEVSPSDLKIRIDLENIVSKPVFGIFKNSTFLQRATLKEVIHAGGGKGFSMIIGVHIESIIKDIFVQSLKQLEIGDSKRIFLVLDLKADEKSVTFPYISLYKDGQHLWSLPIAEVMDATLKQAKP